MCMYTLLPASVILVGMCMVSRAIKNSICTVNHSYGLFANCKQISIISDHLFVTVIPTAITALLFSRVSIRQGKLTVSKKLKFDLV